MLYFFLQILMKNHGKNNRNFKIADAGLRHTDKQILQTFLVVFPNNGGGGQNCLFQYGNTQGKHPGSATVNSLRIAVLFENKVHLTVFKEGCKPAPRRIFC